MLQLLRKKSYFSSLFQIETRKFEKKQKSIDLISIVSIKKKRFYSSYVRDVNIYA